MANIARQATDGTGPIFDCVCRYRWCNIATHVVNAWLTK